MKQDREMLKLVDDVLYSTPEMTRLTMWWVSKNLNCIDNKKRFTDIENRMETLECNNKQSNLESVNQFLKSKPDELDKIFQFKLTLSDIRKLIKAKQDVIFLFYVVKIKEFSKHMKFH